MPGWKRDMMNCLVRILPPLHGLGSENRVVESPICAAGSLNSRVSYKTSRKIRE